MTDRRSTAPAATRSWLGAPARGNALGLVLAFAIVWAPTAAYTLNHFYRDGAVTDSWFLAWVVWRNDWALRVPTVLAEGRSYFGTHISPILLAPALLSHFVPVGMIAWFAAFSGAVHGLVSAAVYHTLRRNFGLATRGGAIAAVAIAACYGLGGLAMAALQLPHFEILIVGFGILFLAALARGDRAWAWLWFVLALSVREDAGFHLAIILFVVQMIHRRREAWIFLIAGLVAGVACFAMKHAFWPNEGQISFVFAGDPPYAHLTRALAEERLGIFLDFRGYIWQMAVVTIAWAVWRRDLLVAAALLASVPWMAINLTAVSTAAGTLDQYYSFPLFLAAAWPLIAPSWRRGGRAANPKRKASLAWAVAMAAFMVLGWRDGFVFYPGAINLAVRATPAEAARVEEFALRFKEGIRELGAVRADASVIGLWPDAGRRIQWLYEPSRFPDSLRGNDTVIWYEPGLQDSLAWAAWLSSRLPNQYRVIGSNIVIATNRRLDQMPTLAPLLVPTDVIARRMRPTQIAQVAPDGLRVPVEAPAGLIAEGPHSWMRYGLNSHHGVALPPGRYEGRFEIRVANVKNRAAPVMRVEIGFYGARVAAAKDAAMDDLRSLSPEGTGPYLITLPFEVTPDLQGRFLQLRAIHVGNAELVLRRIGLVRLD